MFKYACIQKRFYLYCIKMSSITIPGVGAVADVAFGTDCMYIADSANGSIVKSGFNGETPTIILDRNTYIPGGNSMPLLPTSVAVGFGFVYVVDQRGMKIIRMGLNGESPSLFIDNTSQLLEIQRSSSSLGMIGYNSYEFFPWHIRVSPSDNSLYFTEDSAAAGSENMTGRYGCIWKISSNGSDLTLIHTLTQTSSYTDVFVSSNRLYVVCNDIFVYTMGLDGSNFTQSTTYSSGQPYTSIFADSTYLYMADNFATPHIMKKPIDPTSQDGIIQVNWNSSMESIYSMQGYNTSLYVSSMVPSAPIAVFNILIYATPSIPSNLSLSGTILSWTNTDTSVTYKIYNTRISDTNAFDYSNSFLISEPVSATNVHVGTTNGTSLDISSSITLGTNTIYVESYNADNIYLARSAYYTYSNVPSMPTHLSLSGSFLVWKNTTPSIIYQVYLVNALTGNGTGFLGFTNGYSFDMSSSPFAGGINTITVRAYSGYTVIVSSVPYIYTPSTPTNLSLTGTSLSWNNIDTFVSYTITNAADVIIGTTSNHSFDMSASPVPTINITNTWFVNSYDSNGTFLARSAPFYPPFPFSLASSTNVANVAIGNSGLSDMFITKYDTNGGVLWITRIGGTNTDNVAAVSTDSQGNIFVNGVFGYLTTVSFFNASGSGATNTIAITSTSVNMSDVYVAKYNPSGACVWATMIGGNSTSTPFMITSDIYGNTIISGYYIASTLFFYNASGSGVSRTQSIPNIDKSTNYFIAKYNTSGACVWVTNMTTGNLSRVATSLRNSISTDSFGNIFVAGNTNYSTGITNGRKMSLFSVSGSGTTHTLPLTNANKERMFLARYNPSGGCVWVTSIGVDGHGYMTGITSDAYGNTFLTGNYTMGPLVFSNASSSVSISGSFLSSASSYDAFLIKYSPSGTFVWATTIGGAATDSGNGVAMDAQGNVVITGTYSSTTLSFYNVSGSGVSLNQRIAIAGSNDVFLAKYTTNGVVMWATHIGGAVANSGVNVSTDIQGNVFVTGTYSSNPLTFYNASGSGVSLNQSIANAGLNDVFLAKYNQNGVVIWASTIGGAGADSGNGVATDVQGNVVVTGTYSSTSLYAKSVFKPNIVFPSSAYVSLSDVTIGITGLLGCTYNFYLDGSMNISGILVYGTSISLYGLSVGTHSAYLILTDASGNVSLPSVVVSWSVYTPVVYTPSVPPATFIQQIANTSSVSIAARKQILIDNAANFPSPIISLSGFNITPFLTTTTTVTPSQSISMILPNANISSTALPAASSSLYLLGNEGTYDVYTVDGVSTTVVFGASSVTINGITTQIGGSFTLFGRTYMLAGCGSAWIIPAWTANLSGSSNHDGTANISWTDLSSADNFQVEDGNGNAYTTTSLTRNSATVTGLSNLDNVFYVRAIYTTDESGTILSTDSISLIGGMYLPTWTDANIYAVDTQDGSVVVYWADAPGSPDTYSILYTGGSIDGIVSTSATVTGFTNGQSVSFSVVAHYLTNFSGDVSTTTHATITISIGGGGGGEPVFVPCFLGSAPVLTPTGYTNISKLAVGDKVTTADGRNVRIHRVMKKTVATGHSTNPYTIPAGQYGAIRDLAISPNHRVLMSDSSMVEAQHLGLKQQERASGESIEYYNLELPSWSQDNMVVAGVVVESLAPVRRTTMTLGGFKKALVAQYGELTPAILAKVQKTCRLVANGRVECPVLPK